MPLARLLATALVVLHGVAPTHLGVAAAPALAPALRAAEMAVAGESMDWRWPRRRQEFNSSAQASAASIIATDIGDQQQPSATPDSSLIISSAVQPASAVVASTSSPSSVEPASSRPSSTEGRSQTTDPASSAAPPTSTDGALTTTSSSVASSVATTVSSSTRVYAPPTTPSASPSSGDPTRRPPSSVTDAQTTSFAPSRPPLTIVPSRTSAPPLATARDDPDDIPLTLVNVAGVTEIDGRTVTLTGATQTITLEGGLLSSARLVTAAVPARTTVAITTVIQGAVQTQTVVLVPEPAAQLQQPGTGAVLRSPRLGLAAAALIALLAC